MHIIEGMDRAQATQANCFHMAIRLAGSALRCSKRLRDSLSLRGDKTEKASKDDRIDRKGPTHEADLTQGLVRSAYL